MTYVAAPVAPAEVGETVAIADTICIQPGQSEYKTPILNYVIVDTDENTYELKIIDIKEKYLNHGIFE